ncbi:MAG: hypothetical protein M1818_002040 [Claussenomyces sp. TS43310]|nr:MAG: hypothetical protein M1818_002040 [Claussenomyces sp. TS43310]
MQTTLQSGLAAGMSATEGYHADAPTPVDPSFDGTKALLPPSYVPSKKTRVTLRGKNGDIEAPCINIGAWSWGDKASWQWSEDQMPGLIEAWKILSGHGLTWIDTAQAYGSGESERITGELIRSLPRDEVIIQTKWYVVPLTAKNLLSPTHAPTKYLKESLERLGLDYVDSYLVHGHIHASTLTQVAKGLAECVELGLTKTVGVANYSAKDMLELAEELAKYGIPLATNQCEYSVLRRYPETHGLLQACKDNNIVFQSYSSLAQGRLTGKYGPDNPAPSTHRFSSYDPKDIEPTVKVLEDIGKPKGKSPSAVALNYNMSKGVVPTVGVRAAKHAEDFVAALDWRLTVDEIKRLDAVSMDGKETLLWQQG